jgi:hypothetical protein
MESIWLSFLQQVITVIVGTVITAVGGLVGFYINRLINRIKKKELVDEVERRVRWIEKTKGDIEGQQKKEIVMDAVREWALENRVSVSMSELDVIVEAAVLNMDCMKGKENV